MKNVSEICSKIIYGSPWLATGSRGVQKERAASREFFKYLLDPSGPVFEPQTTENINDPKATFDEHDADNDICELLRMCPGWARSVAKACDEDENGGQVSIHDKLTIATGVQVVRDRDNRCSWKSAAGKQKYTSVAIPGDELRSPVNTAHELQVRLVDPRLRRKARGIRIIGRCCGDPPDNNEFPEKKTRRMQSC